MKLEWEQRRLPPPNPNPHAQVAAQASFRKEEKAYNTLAAYAGQPPQALCFRCLARFRLRFRLRLRTAFALPFPRRHYIQHLLYPSLRASSSLHRTTPITNQTRSSSVKQSPDILPLAAAWKHSIRRPSHRTCSLPRSRHPHRPSRRASTT